MAQPEPWAEKPPTPPWMPSGISPDPPEYSDETVRINALNVAAIWLQGNLHADTEDVVNAAKAFEKYIRGE